MQTDFTREHSDVRPTVQTLHVPEQGFRPDTFIAWSALCGLYLNPLLGALGPLVFLALGLYLTARRPGSTIDALWRNWYILILPFYALASTLWSAEPSISARYGMQLVLTMVIGIVIAHRITPYSFLLVSFAASLLIIVFSVLTGGARMDGIALGIFAAKNAYATSICFFGLAALAIVLAPESMRLPRIVGLFGLIATPPLLISAQSSGAFATMAIAVAVLIVFSIGGWLAPRTRQSYFTVLFSVGTVIILLVVVFHQQILSILLDLFEKDATITGRTDLWEIGSALIGQRPFLGMGYQAFWVQETAIAEELWAYFKIPNRGGFHFHNTYISIGVELGLVGSAMTGILLFGSLVRSVQWAVKEPLAVPSYFVAFAVLIASRSLVEVDVFYQFSTSTITIVCGLIYANQALAAVRAYQPRIELNSDVRTILYPARLALENAVPAKDTRSP